MASKLKQQPKKIGGWFWRKLPWYGKLMVPLVVLTAGLYFLDWIVGLFG